MDNTQKAIHALTVTVAMIIKNHPNRKDIIKDLSALRNMPEFNDIKELLDIIIQIPEDELIQKRISKLLENKPPIPV